MPASVAVPLITGGTQLAAGALQSGAINSATAANTLANQQALDFAKKRYARAQQLQQPYLQSGQNANQALQLLLSNAAVRNGYQPLGTNAPGVPPAD